MDVLARTKRAIIARRYVFTDKADVERQRDGLTETDVDESTMLEITGCPTRGSSEIRKVRKSLRREWKGTPYEVPKLCFWECPKCGERLFDHEAMRTIDAHRPGRSRSSARLISS